MDRNPDALNREMRQLMILGYLRRRFPDRLCPREIKDAVYFSYPGETEESTHRRFSDDMKHLRRAGLISYTDLRPTGRVQLTVPQKDRSLYLSLREHTALRDARERLGWISTTSPFDAESGTEKLEHVVRALRLIEEGNTEVSELAAALNERPRKIQQILDRLDGIGPYSEVLTELALERDSDDRRWEAAEMRLGPTDGPMEGRGLDELGLFAYSRDEVDDRIGLIDAALCEEAGNLDAPALESARRKLESWRSRLDQLRD